jgi:hypothetical protein
VAILANLNFRQLTGSIIFALQTDSVSAVKVIALAGHPSVTEKTIEYAKMASGEKDRMMIHQALGFLPSPKGPTFIGKAVFSSNDGLAKTDASEGPETFDKDDDIDELFPPATKIQERLVPIRQRLLPE